MLIISDSHCRLDTFLTEKFHSFSRTYFQYLISEGAVLVNSQVVKKSCKLKPNDAVSVEFLQAAEIAVEPEEIPLDILYEDQHLLAVNKPAGLVVHPAPGNWNKTFVNALLFHCKVEKDDTLRPGIVHRLDKDTSGVIIAAKTRICHQALVQLFAKREVEKSYIALCQGKPTIRTIDAPIARHETKRKLMTTTEHGRAAITHIEVLAFKNNISVLQIQLETGRTHQIRVHLKSIGHPLLGDPVYGTVQYNERLGISRQMLHAYSLSFIHPITKQPLCIKAPLAHDIKKAIDKFIPIHIR